MSKEDVSKPRDNALISSSPSNSGHDALTAARGEEEQTDVLAQPSTSVVAEKASLQPFELTIPNLHYGSRDPIRNIVDIEDAKSESANVSNLNDSAPVISSNGGGASAAVTVAENSTAVTTVTASDAD